MTKASYSNITVYAPLQSSYGFLPASKWPDFMPSLIWTATTDRGSRVVTWEGARLDREVAQPVSFQAEFHDNGEVTYRFPPNHTNMTINPVYRDCEHPFNDDEEDPKFYLEVEAGRETSSGWQHLAWIDTDPETLGLQRRTAISRDNPP